MIFSEDNALAHNSVFPMTEFNELKYELLEHPPYSQDYYFLRNLRNIDREKLFSSKEEAISVVKEYFTELIENHYRDGIKFWQEESVN